MQILALFFIIVLFFAVILLFLVIYSYKKNRTIPILGELARRKYLGAKFELWDALERLEKKPTIKTVNYLVFKWKKVKTGFFYFLALLFRSSHDSYVLLNCDVEKKECMEREYGAHLEAEKRATVLSSVGLSSFIVFNFFIILTITLLPNLFFKVGGARAAVGDIINTVEINGSTVNGPSLNNNDYYGYSVANIGDLNLDGVDDIAVGAYQDDGVGTNQGAFYLHFMNTNGSIDSTVEINGSTANGPSLNDNDFYGNSVANIGDLNLDGVNDIAVGAYFDDGAGINQGAVHIHFMNTDGSIDSTVEINGATLNGPVLSDANFYGKAIANIGDLNGDGIDDLAVGADGDEPTGPGGGASYGAFFIHFMNIDGSIDSTVKISRLTLNGPTLNAGDYYGNSIANIEDLDGDGVKDIMVGAHNATGFGCANCGKSFIHFMNADGSIDSTVEINNLTTNGPSLDGSDNYGAAIANLGDFDGDGVQDIAVGAGGIDGVGSYQGAVYIHLMNTDGSMNSTIEINGSTLNGPSLIDFDRYGYAIANIGDLNNDTLNDIAVGAWGDDGVGTNQGALYIHFMQPPSSYISGRLYSDEGLSPVTSADKDIVVLVNGVSVGTTTTDGSGDYTLRVNTSSLGPTNIITAYINDETENGVAVTVASSSDDIGDLDIYYDYLIVANEDSASSTANADLDIANNGDADIADIYANSGGANLDLAGSLYIRDNYVPGGNISIVGDWVNKGAFTAGTNSVTLDGANQTIKGGNIFYDLAKINSTGVLTFKDSLTQTVINSLNLTGQDSSNRLSIRSTISGVQSYLRIIGAVTTFDSLDIQDNYLLSGTTTYLNPTNSTNSGNTFGWFTPVAIGNGDISSTVKIDSTTPNGPNLNDLDLYGFSTTNIGDLNEDGINDLAIGAIGDSILGMYRGAVYIHFMNTDGSINNTVKIDGSTLNGPSLNDWYTYGSSIANIGDLNGDGVQDLAIGTHGDDGTGDYQGAVYIHFMNTDGSINNTVKIDGSTLNGPSLNNYDYYGKAIANIGDLNGDGVQDLVVGAYGDDGINPLSEQGASYIHFMNIDGSIKSTVKIDGSTVNGPILNTSYQYGYSIANIGDLNNDGIQDLAVGAIDNSGTGTGYLYIHFMNIDGSIDSTIKIDGATLNGPNLNISDAYGGSVTQIGDLNGDGVIDLVVGAYYDTGIQQRGAVYIHFMNTDGSIIDTIKIDNTTLNGPNLSDSDNYGYSITSIGDLNNDGILDLAVGAQNDGDVGNSQGALYIHFMKPLGTTFSGTLYSDEGIAPVTTADKDITVLVNGISMGSDTTDGSGNYSVTATGVTLNPTDVITAYLNDETENGVSVTVASTSADITGLDVYYDYMVVANENNASSTANAQLDMANDGDTDIADIYANGLGSDLDLSANLYIRDTYVPGGNINIAGNWSNAGTFTPGSFGVTFDGSSNQLISNTSTFNNLTLSGSGNYTVDVNPTINGDLTISSGTFDLQGYDLALSPTSNFSNNGTLKLIGSETLTNLTNDADSGSIIYTGSGVYAALNVGNAYHNLSFTGAGAYTLASDLNINNNFSFGATISTTFKTITIDNTKVLDDLTDYPALISLTDLDLRHTSFGGYVADLNGYDIVFKDLSNTVLDFEIEKYTSSTGELIAWVRIPVLADLSNTQINLHFGDPSITTDQSNPTGVWDANYKGVWHMATVNDSTAYNNDGTPSGTMTVSSTSLIGDGVSFDGTDGAINFDPTKGIANLANSTVEAWVKGDPAGQSGVQAPYIEFDGIGGGAGLISETTGAAPNDYNFLILSTGSYLTTYHILLPNAWTNYVGTLNSGSGMTFYVDGLIYDTDPNTDQCSVAMIAAGIGDVVGGGSFNGLIDEVRISDTARSAEWIETEYNNISNPSSFFSVGVMQFASSANTLNLGAFDMNVAGDFTNTNSGIISGSGSVIFDNNAISSAIFGSTSFPNFECTADGKTLTFEAGSTQTIVGDLTLTGTSAIYLRSATPGVQWLIDPQGARSVDYVDVMDSNNINATAITATDSVDSGNNVNWSFSSTPPAPTPTPTPSSPNPIPVPITPPPGGTFEISIASPADFTSTPPKVAMGTVNLSLNGGPDASQMAISLTPGFESTSFVPYSSAGSLNITNVGVYTIYARFMSASGSYSPTVKTIVEVVADSIIETETPIIEPIEPVTPEEPIIDPIVEPIEPEEPIQPEEPIVEPTEEPGVEPVEPPEEPGEEPTEVPTKPETQPGETPFVPGQWEDGQKGVWGSIVDFFKNILDYVVAAAVFIKDGLINAASATLEFIQEFIADPAKKLGEINANLRQFSQTKESLGISTGAAAIVAAVMGLQVVAVIDMISQIPQLLFNLLSSLYDRRRKLKRRGVVYDKATGQPVPFAKVSIIKNGEIMETKFADKTGAYFFLVPSGNYTIDVVKKGYVVMKEQAKDDVKTVYNNFTYTKDKALSFNQDGMIRVGIPLVKQAETKTGIITSGWVYILLDIIFWAGFIFSIVMLIYNPDTLNIVVAVVYFMLFVIKTVFIIRPTWGLVTVGGKVEPFSLVQSFSKGEDKMLARTVTDQHGRYALIMDKGDYTLDVRTPKQKTVKKDIHVKKHGVIDEKIEM